MPMPPDPDDFSCVLEYEEAYRRYEAGDGCRHLRMESSARHDYCPDCGYEFYYGDAHAKGDAQLSRVINKGQE